MILHGIPYKIATGYKNMKENEKSVKKIKENYEKFDYI
jgi:hypothetical protein